MPDVLVVALPLLVTVALLVFFLRRQRRAGVELGARDEMTAVNQLPLRQLWVINRAIRAGRAVDDPALAAQHPDARWTGRTLDPRSTGRQRMALGWAVLVAVNTPLYHGLSLLLEAPVGWGSAAGVAVTIATALIVAIHFGIPSHGKPTTDAR
ncbi:hypothetical protein [Cryptosporangium sp. NPDC048952]|uniref:hypothetical protein n=1 Tax=Cryptosporangium sp. NPDC048952 TaxID=3363961 RepID=UPI0037232D1E